MAKYRATPTALERTMRENDFIVSKTDLKGRITYCNRIFIEFAGYAEHELLGAPHNLIRHPDMPRGVFQFLWDSLHAERECFAYVKNMSKDGGFYWVLANVTPSYGEDGRVEGYFSVRRKPPAAAGGGGPPRNRPKRGAGRGQLRGAAHAARRRGAGLHRALPRHAGGGAESRPARCHVGLARPTHRGTCRQRTEL